MCPLPLGHPSHPPPQLTRKVVTEGRVELPVLPSASPLALCFTRGSVCFTATISSRPLLPPCYVYKSILYVCVSVAAL